MSLEIITTVISSETVRINETSRHNLEDNVKQRKKVAKVKPNPRNVENLSVVGSGENRQRVEELSSVRSSISGHHVSPVGKVPSPVFETGLNTECIQFIRQLWNFHEEALDYHSKVSTLVSYSQNRLRLIQGELTTVKTSSVGKTPPVSGIETSLEVKHDGLTPVEPLSSSSGLSSDPVLPLFGLDGTQKFTMASFHSIIFGLKSISENAIDIEKQYKTLSVFQTQCKLVLYAKVLHSRKYLVHDYMSILHSINQLVTILIQLLALTSSSTSPKFEEILAISFSPILQLVQVYNTFLKSVLYSYNLGCGTVPCGNVSEVSSSEPMEGVYELEMNSTVSKVKILRQVYSVIHNDTPSLTVSLKPFSVTKLFNLFLQKRVLPASRAFTQVLQANFLKGVKPTHHRGSSQQHQQSLITTTLSTDQFKHCFLEEDNRMRLLTTCLVGQASLFGRAEVIPGSENIDERMSKAVEEKIWKQFRHALWNFVGEISQDLLLWEFESSIPLVMFHFDTFVALKNSFTLGGQITGSKMSPIHSTLDSVSSYLHSLTLLLSWDKKIQSCFEIATKIKRPEQIHLNQSPDSTEWATTIGRKFGDIVSTCISLMEGQSPEGVTDSSITSLSPHSILLNQNQEEFSQSAIKSSNTKLRFGKSEEEPLSDEAQILFRLDATLSFYTSWVVKRTKLWLNNWAIPQFLASSQRDSKLLWQLLKSKESILITRVLLLNNENISIRLSAKQRQLCADDFRDSLNSLRIMPEELLQVVGPICETLSLATLQSCMPSGNHWEGIGPGSGLDPDKPSPYVRIFIGRVIEPVIVASVEFVSPSVQEAVGKQVVNAASEAWLQYILQTKIRFSEWGAVQLLRDFMSLRDWICSETSLAEEARKAILELEILKRCQGVAYLLLRSPGDVLGVGKPSRKTKRISSRNGSRESSPSVSESSIAEDDIPPEMYVSNQQMWLELRRRRKRFQIFPLSFCCRD